MLNNEKHDITEDGDNTENELFESAHFTMEEQIYICLIYMSTFCLELDFKD